MIIHALDQPHPVHLVQLPCEGAVAGIAKATKLEAIFPVSIHVAPVGRSGLSVDAEVTKIRYPNTH